MNDDGMDEGGRPDGDGYVSLDEVRREKRARKLRIIDPIKLHAKPVPERRWLVPNWIPHRQVTMLGGDGGDGKTLLTMQLLTACATGNTWLGQPTMRCRVLGVFCEDDADELHRRQTDINDHYGLEFADLVDMEWADRSATENLMNQVTQYEGMQPTDFYGDVMNQAMDNGVQLVVLDSLHDLFGGNENFRSDARQFIGLLRQLAIEIDGAVVLTAHPSLSGLASGSGMSGNTAWNNAVRSRLFLHRDEEDGGDVRLLTRKKANYAGRDDTITMRWSEGVFVADAPMTPTIEGIVKRSADTAFLECLDVLTKRGVPVNDAVQSAYAPKVMVGMKQVRGFKQRDLEMAMKRLLSDGAIEMEITGPASRPKRRFVRSPT